MLDDLISSTLSELENNSKQPEVLKNTSPKTEIGKEAPQVASDPTSDASKPKKSAIDQLLDSLPENSNSDEDEKLLENILKGVDDDTLNSLINDVEKLASGDMGGIEELFSKIDLDQEEKDLLSNISNMTDEEIFKKCGEMMSKLAKE
jgi:hypothetical protein